MSQYLSMPPTGSSMLGDLQPQFFEPGATLGGNRTVWEVALFREVVAPWRAVAVLRWKFL